MMCKQSNWRTSECTPEVIEMLLTPKLCGLVRKSKNCGHEIPYVVIGNIMQDRTKGST